MEKLKFTEYIEQVTDIYYKNISNFKGTTFYKFNADVSYIIYNLILLDVSWISFEYSEVDKCIYFTSKKSDNKIYLDIYFLHNESDFGLTIINNKDIIALISSNDIDIIIDKIKETINNER